MKLFMPQFFYISILRVGGGQGRRHGFEGAGQCSLQRSCTLLWSVDIPLLGYSMKKIHYCVVWISIIGIDNQEIYLCLVDSRTNI